MAVESGNVGSPQRRLSYFRVTQMPESAFISLNLDYSLTVFPAVFQEHLGTFLQDLRRHFAVASVKKRVHGKVLKEPTSSPTSIRTALLCYHTHYIL